MLSKRSIHLPAVAAAAAPALKTCVCAVLTALLILVSFAAATRAQFASPGELPGINAPTRAAIVDSITAAIDSIYVLEKPAKSIVAGLRKNLADGAYENLSDPTEFVEQLYRDAQAIHHDAHFRIVAMYPLDPAVQEERQDEDPAEVELRRRLTRAKNYGFQKVEIFPGGIGYLRFDQFSRGDEAYEVAAAAMNFLANSNALILDLRENGGGSASMIRFICGYLFEEKQHLINWDIRAEKKTVQSHSPDYVPGRRSIEQPVYILTSDRTFSAAEEFSFDLRNLERATIVGDTTGGGGHTVETCIFSFDGFRVGIRIPYGRAYNPENNEGWEGVGVIPHIAVPAEEALDAARAHALRKLIETEENERILAGYRWNLTDIESRINPVELPKSRMKQYVGVYGPRRIFIDGGALYYQREDRPRMELTLIGEDLFRVGDLDYFRISFGRNASGKITKIVGTYDNGRTDENERDKN